MLRIGSDYELRTITMTQRQLIGGGVMGLPTPFPSGALKATANPAIRLFGLRFFKDQTILEYLAEFCGCVSRPSGSLVAR